MANKPDSSNSVFVCCRTSDPDDEHCDHIGNTIRGLGRAATVFSGCWYLETALDISQVKMRLTPTLSANDTLLVIDATNHQTAWRNILPAAAELIRETWDDGALPSSLQRIAPKHLKRA